jgi:hypothetical protein
VKITACFSWMKNTCQQALVLDSIIRAFKAKKESDDSQMETLQVVQEIHLMTLQSRHDAEKQEHLQSEEAGQGS